MEGFLLGLANGGVCLGYCAPVIAPFLVGERRGVRGNLAVLAVFLAGRLSGYLSFGVGAWFIYHYALNGWQHSGMVTAAAQIALGIMLLCYGLSEHRGRCAGQSRFAAMLNGRLSGWKTVAFMFGLFTGLNLCPPFLLAVTQAVNLQSLSDGLAFFLAFFMGSSLLLLPVSALGAFSKLPAIGDIGKIASILASLYYIATGVAALFGGVI